MGSKCREEWVRGSGSAEGLLALVDLGLDAAGQTTGHCVEDTGHRAGRATDRRDDLGVDGVAVREVRDGARLVADGGLPLDDAALDGVDELDVLALGQGLELDARDGEELWSRRFGRASSINPPALSVAESGAVPR